MTDAGQEDIHIFFSLLLSFFTLCYACLYHHPPVKLNYMVAVINPAASIKRDPVAKLRASAAASTR